MAQSKIKNNKFEVVEPIKDSQLDQIQNNTNPNIGINEILSDHYAQSMRMTKEYWILTWNVMTQAKFTRRGPDQEDRTNNGFGVTETKQQYFRRLHAIAARIAKELNSKEYAIATLQEVPVNDEQRASFYQYLQDELGKSSEWLISDEFFSPTTIDFGKLTLINLDYVQSAKKLELPVLGLAKNRVLITDIVLKKKQDEVERKIRIVNVHLKARQHNKPTTPHDVFKDLDQLLTSTKEQVVIAGDFNQDPKDLSKQYYPDQCYVTSSLTSFSYSREGKVGKCIDGFLFKYSPERYSFTEEEKKNPNTLQERLPKTAANDS